MQNHLQESEGAHSGRLFGLITCVGLVLLVLHACAAAAVAEDDAAVEDKARRLKQMTQMARAIKVYQKTKADDRVEIELNDQPLLRFNDRASPLKFSDGTVWAFGDKGRPLVILAIERYSRSWAHELISLADRPDVSAVMRDGWRWQPREPGVVLKPVPGSPAVGDAPKVLQRQLKTLARRFRVLEIGSVDGKDYALRLMSTPIHTYSNPETGLLAGAIFIFAYGTNPETILILEARKDESEDAKWMFSFAPLTAAIPKAHFNDEQVWKGPEHSTFRRHTPYTHFSYPAERIEAEE